MKRTSGSMFDLFGALGLAALLATPVGAGAQERVIPLDTVRVDVVSRATGQLGAATRAVEVITAEAIRRSPVSTVTEALRWALGVDLMPRSPALADVALRGSSFEQVLVLVDGVRMSDAQTGHFDLNLAVPLDQVERIEILRGAASSLHGADAMGGVINVVTRRAGRGTSARVEAGSFGTSGLALSHGARAGGVHLDAAGELRRSDGHRSGTDYAMGSARLALQAPLAGNLLVADAAYAARNFGADGFYGPFPSYEETRTLTASLGWRVDAGRRLAVEPLLGVRRNEDDFVLRRQDPSFYRNRHATVQLGGGLTARYAASPLLRVAAGVEAYRDRLESASLGDRAEDRSAALLEVAAGRVGRLSATAGARADRHAGRETAWSPSLSLAWWPAAGTRLRASGGHSFRTPTWTERYYRDPANVGDPSLAPERARSLEAGIDLAPSARLHLGATAFLRDAEDLIDWARPIGQDAIPYRTRNVGRARFSGLEAEAGLDRALGLRWTARGSWLSVTSSAEAGYRSKYALRPLVETASLGAERGFAGGGALALQGVRARRSGEAAHLRIDARASHSWRAARVFADLRNALDEEYPDITGHRAEGRALVLGVEWRAPR
jgi:outer membrane cobalamin receptor